MTEKKTVIERIKILASGSIQLRFAKMIVDGDKIVGAPQWHRCALDPGTDIDAMMAAINNHLEQMGEARCGEEQTPYSIITPQFLKEKILLIHTPELVAEYKAKQDKALEALKPSPTLFQKILNALSP